MLGIVASPSEEIQLPNDVSVLCSSAGQQKEGCGDNSSPGEAIIVAEKKLGKKNKNNDKKKKKKKSHSSPSNNIKDATSFVLSEKQSKRTTKENNYAWSAFQSSPDPSTLPDIGGLFSTSLNVGERKQDVVCDNSSSTVVEEEKVAVSSFSSIEKNEKMEELLFQQQNSREYEEIIPTIAAPKIIKNRHEDRTFLHQNVRQEEKQKHQLFSDPIMELMNPGGYDLTGYYGNMVVPSPIPPQQHQYHHPMQYYQSPHHSEKSFLPPSAVQFHQHLPPCNNSSPVVNTTILQNEEKD
jgi:hypothetical protein